MNKPAGWCALHLLLALSLSACARPGMLLKQWPDFIDPRLTLADLNQDTVPDYLLTGYAFKPRKDTAGKPLTDSVMALDARSGKRLWAYATDGHIAGYPTLYRDKVYVGSADRKIYALSAKNGYVQWKYATGGEIRGTLAAGYGHVYIGSRDRFLYALKADTGQLAWRFQAAQAFDAPPALYQRQVLAASWDQHLYALDARSGQLQWKFKAGSYLSAAPVVDRGVVYQGSWDHFLYALDASTGKLRWRFETRGVIEHASAVVFEDTVYVGSNDKYFYAIDRRSGGLKWAFETADAIYATPAVSDLGVYFSCRDGYLYALTHAGELRWKERLNGAIRSSPALGRQEVLVGSPQSGLSRLYDPFAQVHWGMYGGDPTHWQSTALAAKEIENIQDIRSGWWLARLWQDLSALFS